MSALLTTTMPYMKVVIDTLKEKGLRDQYIVMVGGAPLNEEFGRRSAPTPIAATRRWMPAAALKAVRAPERRVQVAERVAGLAVAHAAAVGAVAGGTSAR